MFRDEASEGSSDCRGFVRGILGEHMEAMADALGLEELHGSAQQSGGLGPGIVPEKPERVHIFGRARE